MTSDETLDDALLRRLADVGGVVFDVDGCLILSDQPAGHDGSVLTGAVETVTAIRDSGRRVVAFTNASNRPPALIRDSLNALGFGFADGEVLTPSVVAAAVVRERFGDSAVLAFGQSGVLDVLRDAGVNLIAPDDGHGTTAGEKAGEMRGEPAKVAAVVVGWDVAFDQVKLQAAAEAIWAGAPLLVTSDAPPSRPVAGVPRGLPVSSRPGSRTSQGPRTR